MKNIKFNITRTKLLFGLIFLTFIGCERELSDDAVIAGYPTNGDIFLDGFTSGDLNYAPYAGSYLEAFTVDTETKYNGSAGMRFDVPNFGDPNGAFAGAAFFLNSGRDLSGYDALTFWAKGTEGRTINSIGFGQDFDENKYEAELSGGLQLTTNWRKYIIPIPDPLQLINERGMFWYAEGPDEDGTGWTFWIDELQFEKLGTIAQPRPKLYDGTDQSLQTFIGATGSISPTSPITQTFNSENGDITVNAKPGYFIWTSSNPNVASIDEYGNIESLAVGTTVMTGTIDGIELEGSLTIEVLGDYVPAPVPDRDSSSVISVFSDAYTNVPVDYYNGYFNGDGQTTQGQNDIFINGDNVIYYTDLNFVGIGTFLNVDPLNLSGMTHLHVDINVQEAIDAGDQLTLQLLNGVQTSNETSGSIVLNDSQLLANEWASFDIPLSSFTGLDARDAIGLLFFISNNSSNIPTISNIFVDNIYYYTEQTSPIDAPEEPTEDEIENNVISVFSDVYTDIGNDGLNNFNSGSILSVETIANNDVLKYTNLNFTGLEFLGPNIINASEATTLHLDIWSPDANEFKIKLVDFGPDGEFDGGDDSEWEINLGPTATGEWIALDIPLSEFIGLNSTENLAQIILVNAPVGTLFVDNLYFYN
jgi:hypothetical protein